MFILDVPPIPASQAVVSTSQRTSYGAIGICHSSDYPNFPGIHTYHPEPGYLGPDRMPVVATIGDKTLRLEYFVRVMQYVPVDDREPDLHERSYCPVNARVWKIGMLPNPGIAWTATVACLRPGLRKMRGTDGNTNGVRRRDV